MADCICVRRGDGPEGCGICNETGTTPDIAGLCERQLVTITHKLPEVAFLAENARYFETRPTGGEDAAHWSNVFNAKNCRQAADTLERQAAEIERLRDKVEGLESDLRCAVQVAYNRGATVWARLNYPDMIEWLESCAEDRAALTGEDTATLGLSGKTQTDDRTRGSHD